MCVGCNEKNKVVRELKYQLNWQREESISLKKQLLNYISNCEFYSKQHQLVMSKLFFLEERISRIEK